MKEAKTLYRKESLAGLLSIWKRGMAGLFPSLFLCRLLLCSIFLPLLGESLNLVLRWCGYSYLNVQNLPAFLSKPLSWLYLLICFFFLSLWCLIEQMVTTFYFRLKEQGMEFRLYDLIRFCVLTLQNPIKRGASKILITAFLQGILSGTVTYGFLLNKVRIPNNIWIELKGNFLLLLGTLLFVGILVTAGFRQIFVTQYYMIEGIDYSKSREKGHQLLRRNRLRTLASYFIMMIVFGVLSSLVYILFMTMIAVSLKVFMKDTLFFAKFLAIYDSLNLFWVFLVSTFSVFLFQGMVTHFFYQYKDEWNELTSKELEFGYVKKTLLKRYVILTRIFIAAVIVISLISTWQIFRNGTFQTADLLPVTEITAHRGQSKIAPENTIPALKLAIEQSADYAEIDVRLTLDGVVVLMHDLSLKRTCGVSKKVKDVTYDELMEMDAGVWFSDSYRGTKVPTLAEVMELCKGNVNLNIEIKTSGDTEEIVKKVVDLIEEYDFEKQCIISSTDYSALLEVKKQNENIRTGYIMSMVYGDYYDKEGIDFFSMKSSFVTQSAVERIHMSGKEIHVWTVNGRNELNRVRNLGVDNIITDDAILARKICVEERIGTILGILRIILKS